LLLRHNIKLSLGSFNAAAIAVEPQKHRGHDRDGKQLRQYNPKQLRDVERSLQQ
jgi:hypothetical protein